MEEQAGDETFEALLRFMRDSRGFDFTGYKRSSLMRRVRHRMERLGEDFVDPDSFGEVIVDAVNRRRRSLRIRVTCTAFRNSANLINGALLLMEPRG